MSKHARKWVSRVPYSWESRSKWFDAPFPLKEYEERIGRVRKKMEENGIECLFVFGGPGHTGYVRYLSNFDSFFGNTVVILPSEGDLILTTDSVLHGEPMHSAIWMTWIKDIRPAHHPATIFEADTLIDHLRDVIVERRLAEAKVGIVGDSEIPASIFDGIESCLAGARIVSATQVYLEVTSIKSALEIDLMRKAAHIADLGHQAALDMIKPRVTELALAAAAYSAIAEAGGADVGSAISSGSRSGLKHVFPTSRKLERGDMVFLDIGCTHGGYWTDTSRCAIVGRPSDSQRVMLESALEIEERIIASAKPGVAIGDLVEMGNNLAKETGLYDFYFANETVGHGIGTQMVETPWLVRGNQRVLEKNMTFCVEPMIVKKDFGTACFED